MLHKNIAVHFFFILGVYFVAFSCAFADSNVIQPRGGDVVQPGAMYTVAWDTTASSGVASVLLWNAAVGQWTTIADSVQASAGSVEWNVSASLNGSSFRIMVKSLTDPTWFRMSDSYFSVQTGGMGKSIANQRYAGRAGNVPIVESPIFLQVAPNPFNPVTQVSFTIPDEDASDVTEVRVFDMMARDVTTLINNVEPAGRHTITFNASNLPSGQYIVAVHTLNHMQSKLIILTK